MSAPVTIWYLEMTASAQLRPARAPEAGAAIERLDPPEPELNRRLYEAVGGDWGWTDRRGWDDARWRSHVTRDEVETWLLRVGGQPAGYAELIRARGEVEIASFGLLRNFHGRGLGGALLTAAVQGGWAQGAGRVWLHTCSLDSPVARPSYERRGFRLYREEAARATA